ncbi:PucR family transcriptional regulator [Tepidibacter mesophilus]|uniref:PucR family transcriptional regulator n=1 Tax=Tepidibacter mesophilus TaxID=655607 RepID=UPI001FA8F280|nr:helix-turn-helix domain-containing protein [Tepidibacter mesophilus]
MPKLKILLDFLKDRSNAKISGQYNPSCIINEILFLQNNTELSSNTLYLTTTFDKSLFISEYNILIVTHKINKNTNALQIETQDSVEKIYKLIYEFMLIKYRLYEKKYEIHNSLYNCNDTNKILNIGEYYLSNPIFILDTSYRIIARSTTAVSVVDDIQNYNGESYLLVDTVNMMKKNKCIDNIYSSNRAFFHFSDKNLIFCGIRINNVTVSYICVLQKYRQFTEDDLELTNTLSQTLSIQLQRDNSFINSSGLEEEYYLMDLLMNRIDNLHYIKQRLETVNFKLNKNILLISIPFCQTYQDYHYNTGLKQLINTAKNILGNCISAYYEDMIIFMVSKRDDEVLSKNANKKFEDFLILNNLKAGISLIFENLLETKEFYVQSKYALKLAEHLNIDSRILYFKNYMEYYLFYISQNLDIKVPKIELHTLIHPLIKKLIDIEKNNNTELLKTLTIYLESNRNANDASKKLNIHRSTFFYRFHKIEELLNVSLNNSDILFKLELSLKILKFQKYI